MTRVSKCKICNRGSSLFSNTILLKKYEVGYYKCDHCGFIQTEEPYWLNEAYSEAINRNDVGLVDRNVRLSVTTQAIVSAFLNPSARFVDYGGGYGLFVRLMRDAGFDFYRYDKYCENLFAQDFEATLDINTQYELLTAFEVFEHLVNPVEEIEQMLCFSKSILFTTEILPDNSPKPDEWWYYIPDYGQHVSFYTMKSLLCIAKKYSLNLYSNGRSLHFLTANKIPPNLFKLVCRHRITALVNKLRKRRSLIADDYYRITNKILIE